MIAIVTGATSGFGKATAEKFAAAKYNVIITGRRNELLQQVSEHIQKAYGVKVLALNFDVRDKQAVNKNFGSLPADWHEVDVLVNNAGLALGKDYFEEADMNDWETMIDTNVKGLLYVSRAVLPYMVKRKKGHILNIGSIAGQDTYEKGNVYCATKSSVQTISRAMRVDLLRHHIKVTAIHPGAAETEFSIVRFKGDESAAKAVYDGYQALTAEDVADVVFYCASLPAHVCINDLTLTPTAQADAFYFHKDQ
ncbi:MAG: SDR family NAD(P)-dependent oxidoreductase [Chitinophagaceae bacterium]|nr:SDR family NAD(P)-dependent oxidoreductase [Chitinophagaceae bacterium]